MLIVDGIACADTNIPQMKVCGVRPLDGHRLWLRFSTGEVKVFDFTPLLSEPAFLPLNDPDVFNGVYIDYGATTWNDGEIDISPEYLYENALSLEDATTSKRIGVARGRLKVPDDLDQYNDEIAELFGVSL